jgi:hypothetical protein
MTKLITRRDFIRGSAGVVLGAAIGFSAEPAKKSRVVLIRNPEALDANSRFNAEVIQQMLDKAVMALLDKSTPEKAFQTLVKAGEVVGIKSNVWSYLPTPVELEQALKRRIVGAGVKEEDIGIDDHGVRENPIFKKATSLFNVRPIRTHYLAGMSGCMKNYIMFAPSQQALHPNSCADLGLCYKLPMVKGKTRLNILCCLTPQFHGRGPHHFSRRYVWNYCGILVGKDPVAVDAVGLELIKAKRRQVLGKARELPPVPKHIQVADTKHGIGTSDLNKIELIKLGWDQDILI